jgi:hypothetical protein
MQEAKETVTGIIAAELERARLYADRKMQFTKS